MRLVVWDIDHTSTDTGGVGRQLFAADSSRDRARDQPQAAVDGLTDAVIFRETTRLHELDTAREDFERSRSPWPRSA